MRISDWSSDVCSSDLPTAAYMKPEKSGTAPICSRLASGYCHDPAAVLNSSINVPTRWKIRMTTASFGVSRLEERRVGKECVSTCRSRWEPDHEKKKS